MDSRNFFTELKRRHVYKVAVAYAVVAWLLIQAASILFPTFEAPAWVMKTFIGAVVLGFPIALILAWAFELTPEGIKRTEENEPARSRGRAWIYVAIVAATLSIGLFFLGRFTATKPGATTEVSSKSIAVLPFESLSEDKRNAYFADGIQDEILARLSKIADLKVISRTSTQKYKSAPNNLREIAQQLGVSNILEGSVQKAGDKVRVTVQLINALKDEHLWADTYDRSLTDIFGVESDVAQKIAGSLEAKLTGREQEQITDGGTKNLAAYDAFLRGLALVNIPEEEPLKRLVQFAQRAVELDPNYAQAWAMLSIAKSQQYFSAQSFVDRKDQARAAAENALRLAPELAEAHQARGVFSYYCLSDYDGALAELEQARSRAPRSGDVLKFIGLVERRQGKLDESIAVQQEAATLDPLNPDIWSVLGGSYRGARKFEQANMMFDRALAITPNDTELLCDKAENYIAQGGLDSASAIVSKLKISLQDGSLGLAVELLGAQRRMDERIAQIKSAKTSEEFPLSERPSLEALIHAWLANLYLEKGDRAGAESYIQQAERDLVTLRENGNLVLEFHPVFIPLEARLGHRDEVERQIQEMFAETGKDKWTLPNAQRTAAIGYMLLGDLDRAFPLLQSSLSRPSPRSLTIANLRLEPIWDPIRHDPRFQQLSGEMK